VDPESSEPKTKSASEDDEDPLPKEKRPLRRRLCLFADGAVKKEVKPVALDLRRDREISTGNRSDESCFLVRCLSEDRPPPETIAAVARAALANAAPFTADPSRFRGREREWERERQGDLDHDRDDRRETWE
jgi:hypothetical protein